MKILIVEDDKISRNIFKKHLTKAGFCVSCAANGQEALDLFDDDFFPIVLTDWMMPEIDGIQLCNLIREKRTDGYVYIVLITARDSKTDTVSGLESGADDYLTKPINPAELIARINSGMRILKLEASLKQAQEDIRRLSVTDSLTGCFNRGYLNERLPQELIHAQKHSKPLSLVMTDIDYFKKVNDTYGHPAGDEVLKLFTECIHQQIRKKVDWVVRYGGEEFLIILPQTTCSGAYDFAERLRSEVESKVMAIGSRSIQITASFGGVCTFQDQIKEKMTMEQMIQLADEQLYQSKRNGRNQVCISDFIQPDR